MVLSNHWHCRILSKKKKKKTNWRARHHTSCRCLLLSPGSSWVRGTNLWSKPPAHCVGPIGRWPQTVPEQIAAVLPHIVAIVRLERVEGGVFLQAFVCLGQLLFLGRQFLLDGGAVVQSHGSTRGDSFNRYQRECWVTQRAGKWQNLGSVFSRLAEKVCNSPESHTRHAHDRQQTGKV